MIEWCNSSSLSPIIMAAISHLWFLTIHPFDDGNGRIARTLSEMFLSRLDPNSASARYYSISNEINRDKKNYYELLENTQRGDMNITEWIIWFIGCLERAILRASESVRISIEKGRYWDNFRNVDVNERQRKIVNRLWDGFEGKLTSSKWAKICSCSSDTALRDINDLIAKGMLQPSGEKGRNTSYVLSRLGGDVDL